jgi:hypothetical protein
MPKCTLTIYVTPLGFSILGGLTMQLPPRSSPDEVKLLEYAADDGCGLEAHPFFDQGCVGASEVVVEVEVSFQQLTGL